VAGAAPIKSARVAQSPFSTGREWYKIKTTDEGLVRVTGLNLTAAGISINGLRSDSLHLFYGGGEPIPDDNSTQVNPFEEISILVEDNGDGAFGRDDHFLFFCRGRRSMAIPNVSSPDYLENHYTDANYYWLAVSGDFPAGGKRIGTIDGTPSGSADTLLPPGALIGLFPRIKCWLMMATSG